MDLTEGAPARRRRGQALEDALLEAAWDELVAGGYGSFTIDSVAERAHTSRPVLSRRWSSREELVLAAIRHRGESDVTPLPDTGSLRGDVLALLSEANRRRRTITALLSVQLGAYYKAGMTPAQIRLQLVGGRTPPIETIIQRAVERGEIDPARLTARISSLPFDLLRHEVMMTLEPVAERTIVEIVDDIFMPLVGDATTGPAKGPRSA